MVGAEWVAGGPQESCCQTAWVTGHRVHHPTCWQWPGYVAQQVIDPETLIHFHYAGGEPVLDRVEAPPEIGDERDVDAPASETRPRVDRVVYADDLSEIDTWR